jgi:hypothetical protein
MMHDRSTSEDNITYARLRRLQADVNPWQLSSNLRRSSRVHPTVETHHIVQLVMRCQLTLSPFFDRPNSHRGRLRGPTTTKYHDVHEWHEEFWYR